MSLDNSSQIIAWFNNQPFHTSTLSMNMVHNAMIRSKLGSKYGIHLANHPLPFRVESAFSLLRSTNAMGFQLATNISFAMAFVSSLYVMFYIRERVSKAKLQQYISGLNVSTFWMASFLFDFITFIVSAFILILVLWAFQEDGWQNFQQISPAFVSLAVFGLAMLPIIYLASLFITIPSTGFVRMTIFFVFTGQMFKKPKVQWIITKKRHNFCRNYGVLHHCGNGISGIRFSRHGKYTQMDIPRFSTLFAWQQFI